MRNTFIIWFFVILVVPAVVWAAAGDADIRRGDEAFNKGDFVGAARYYESALFERKSADVYTRLGHARGRLGDWERAVRAYEAAVEYQEEEGLPQLLRFLGQAQSMAGEFAGALESFEKVYAISPEVDDMLWMGRCYVQTGQWSRGENALLRYLEGRPDSSEGLELLAYLFARSGRSDEAAIIYKKLIKNHPGRMRHLMQLANIQTEAQYYDQAIETLEFARQVGAEQSVEADRLLADLYTNKKMYREAAACYQRIVLASETGAVDDYYRMGYAYYNVGEYLSASEAFEKIRQLAPADARAVLQLGYIAGKKGDSQKARQYYSEAIEIDPSEAEAYIALGALEFEGENFSGAAKYFSKAISAGESGAQVYYNYALSVMLGEDTTAARDAVTKALKKHPTNKQLNDLLDSLIKKTVGN